MVTPGFYGQKLAYLLVNFCFMVAMIFLHINRAAVSVHQGFGFYFRSSSFHDGVEIPRNSLAITRYFAWPGNKYDAH